MIERTIYRQILLSISQHPVTLITGARQVGKTTLCLKLRDEKGFNYVTLRDKEERDMARKDPGIFLQIHECPLIIDEAQYAPELLETIESIVDKKSEEGKSNKGMFVITGSQAYDLLDKASDSLAGRLSMVNMSPLSISEIAGREEPPFCVDIVSNIKRSMEYSMNAKEFYKRLIHGSYPGPETDDTMTPYSFYSDYVDTYINRDVSKIINVRNKDTFHSFMQLVASLTGQELNYNAIASAVGIDNKTAKSWMSVLIAGDIVHLLQPYSDRSTKKRIVKSPKLYFWDTGLACHLAKVLDPDSLMAGYLKGPMVETFIVNEIMKTHRNNKTEYPCYFYRDSNNSEIDLIMVKDGNLSLIECKSGSEFGWNDIKTLEKGIPSQYPIGNRCVICLTTKAYPINERIYALPVTAI